MYDPLMRCCQGLNTYWEGETGGNLLAVSASSGDYSKPKNKYPAIALNFKTNYPLSARGFYADNLQDLLHEVL